MEYEDLNYVAEESDAGFIEVNYYPAKDPKDIFEYLDRALPALNLRSPICVVFKGNKYIVTYNEDYTNINVVRAKKNLIESVEVIVNEDHIRT